MDFAPPMISRSRDVYASLPRSYAGGYNQQLASSIQYDFTFAEAVSYKLFAVQIQRVQIDGAGQMTASLH